jgi:hypothetical protein
MNRPASNQLSPWDAAQRAADVLLGDAANSADLARIARAFYDRPDFWRRRRVVIIEANIRAALDAHHDLKLPPPSPATRRTLAALRADLGQDGGETHA